MQHESWFDDLVAKEKIECCFRRNGYYEIYLTESGFEAAKRGADFLRAYGFHRNRFRRIACGNGTQPSVIEWSEAFFS